MRVSGSGSQSDGEPGEPEESPQVAKFRLDSFRGPDSPSVRELIFKFQRPVSVKSRTCEGNDNVRCAEQI